MPFNFRRPRYSSTSSALQLRDMLRASVTVDVGSVAAVTTVTTTVTVTGAQVGDDCVVTPTLPVAGLVYSAYVSAANTVTIRLINITAAPIDPPSNTYRVIVFTQY